MSGDYNSVSQEEWTGAVSHGDKKGLRSQPVVLKSARSANNANSAVNS